MAFVAAASTVVGILLLIAFIGIRRLVRLRFFRQRSSRTMRIREDWDKIVSGEVPAGSWLFRPLDRQIVEGILLDQLDVAGPVELGRLRQFARKSGLLDMRIRELRHGRGWQRRQALLVLGRMRISEAIPALGEALADRSSATVVDAVRGLGRIGTPHAAELILERLAAGGLPCPPQTLQMALANCFRGHAGNLLKMIAETNDSCRPVLTRVLAEVARRGVPGDLLPLTVDLLAEVRASAARVIAAVRPPYALAALTRLATDEEWFVRLRAVVALGELREPSAIRPLVKALCDANRLVRLRAATALVHYEGEEGRIFQLAFETRDRYALQALVSEMERSGRIPALVAAIADPERRAVAEAALRAALEGGASRILIDLWLFQTDRLIRVRLGRLLARSFDAGLLGRLEELEPATTNARHRRMMRWMIASLRKARSERPSEPVIAA